MKITKEILADMKRLVDEGKSQNEISSLLNLASSTIRKYIKSNYQPYVLKHREYRKDLIHDYFNLIDTNDKAYFLGFISGDGNVRDSMIRIRIVKDDEEVVNKFKECIKYYGKNNYVKGKIGREQVHLVFRSEEMVRDLEQWNITHNKTFSLRMPKIDKKQMSAYLLGFFDADGSIFYTKFARKTGSRAGEVTEKYRFDITTNYDMALEIVSFLNAEINTSLKVYKNKKNENVASIQVSRNEDMLKLQSYLYNDDSLGLKRKKDKFKLAYDFYTEGCSTTKLCGLENQS